MIEQITELQAIAQSGLGYCEDEFGIMRYKRILEIAANLLSLNSNHSYGEVLELFNKDNGYATPKVDVRGAVFEDNKILLVQEKSDQLWTLPGGWADVNLTPTENILKEIEEEAGYVCEIVKLIGIFDKRKTNRTSVRWPHVYRLFYQCRTKSLEKLEFDKNEILNVDFFDHNNIPALSLGRTSKDQIDLCFKHYHNPSLSPELD